MFTYVLYFICLSCLKLQIIDVATGEQIGVNQTGEVCIRSNSVMKGYLHNEQTARQTIDENGWLHTGSHFANTS